VLKLSGYISNFKAIFRRRNVRNVFVYNSAPTWNARSYTVSCAIAAAGRASTVEFSI